MVLVAQLQRERDQRVRSMHQAAEDLAAEFSTLMAEVLTDAASIAKELQHDESNRRTLPGDGR